MPHYRAYFLRRDNSSSAIDLQCADDAHAIETVTGMGCADPIELWQGTRRIRESRSPIRSG